MRLAKPEGIPLEVLFSLVTEEGTERLRLVRPLVVG